jgi:hypothetical protein
VPGTSRRLWRCYSPERGCNLNTFPQLADRMIDPFVALRSIAPEQPRFTDVEVLLLQRLARLGLWQSVVLRGAAQEVAEALSADGLVWGYTVLGWCGDRAFQLTKAGREALEEFYSTQQESARSV